MNNDEILSIDTTIEDALRRESELKEFYETSMHDIGYDASGLFAELAMESECRIARLEELQDNVKNLRVLWSGMVD